MKPTLLILAAGMGSRYGSLKQMDGLGPNGEAIIDYSIYDAIRAGFGKIVFVIRHSFAEPFKEHFQAEKFGGDVKFEFVYQELEYLPEGYSVPEGRVKPWGTNHAVMMAKDVIKEPFAVINADDFYGKESYQTMADYLRSIEGTKGKYSMIGYRLENTLSDFGSVSRGVCETDSNGLLTSITERTAISRKGDKVVFAEGDTETELNPTCPVSMNFWGFTPEYFDYSEEVFKEFLDGALASGNLKAEFFIPYIVDKLIARGEASVKVLDCDAKWFGVTYKEDRPFTVEKINALISAGVYPKKIREF
ncbi:MAG: nucleotidyltransferase [Bacteroidales bacterium]|nr:nucleotidyltransferase [Bacteroidales bacterium]